MSPQAWPPPAGPQVIAGSGKSGPMPAGAQPIIQTGRVSATTDGWGRVTVTFDSPFPGGVSSVMLLTASGTGTSLVLNADTLSVNGFQAIAPSVGNVAIVFYFLAVGW